MSDLPKGVPGDQAEPTDPRMWDEQVYLYAEELQELYRIEQQERQALGEEKLVLQYRMKELTSLNALFQQQLDRVDDYTVELRHAEAVLRKALASKSWEEAQALLKPLLADVAALLGEAGEPGPPGRPEGGPEPKG